MAATGRNAVADRAASCPQMFSIGSTNQPVEPASVSNLPAGFAGLARMTAKVIPSAATTTATRTAAAAGTAAAAFGFWTGFIDVQSASAKFFSVQGRDGLFGFARVGHFNKCKASRATGIAVGYYADLLDRAMRRKQRSQFRFRGAVGNVADKKLFHRVFASFTQNSLPGPKILSSWRYSAAGTRPGFLPDADLSAAVAERNNS